MRGDEALKRYNAVFFDLRSFSDINRVFGVANGNRILANFGEIMQSKIERDEILGRQFGNQFLAIVKDRNLDDLLRTLSGVEVPFMDIETKHENKVVLSSRIGVYKIDRCDLEGEDFLVLAAQALVEAKMKDSDDIVWLTREMLDGVAERKKREKDIKAGLRNGEFRPYYQPKVNAKSGKLCGIEALSRWFHDGNVITPGGFIQIMEANDTIRFLDMHILKCVCEDISGWLKEGIDIPVVSVNFSRRNLADHELAKKIDSVVRASKIPKERIEIEVTETADEFSISVLNNFVNELHELGYKVSIDDFGCASSSLTLLREITFDTIKIDKGFVEKHYSKDLTILEYIVKMAKSLELQIVAEGIENAEQVDTLVKMGVSIIQGFYYDRPLPSEKMVERLKSPQYEKQVRTSS